MKTHFGIEAPLLEPKEGDLVINDCDEPYIFEWGEDDATLEGETWPVLVRDGKPVFRETPVYKTGLYNLLDPEMPAQQMRLHCGELTASEIRLARAILVWANSQAVAVLLPHINRMKGSLEAVEDIVSRTPMSNQLLQNAKGVVHPQELVSQIRDTLATLEQAMGASCKDEGCPHYGTRHGHPV